MKSVDLSPQRDRIQSDNVTIGVTHLKLSNAAALQSDRHCFLPSKSPLSSFSNLMTKNLHIRAGVASEGPEASLRTDRTALGADIATLPSQVDATSYLLGERAALERAFQQVVPHRDQVTTLHGAVAQLQRWGQALQLCKESQMPFTLQNGKQPMPSQLM